jgi:uncharacterized protein YkwD
MRKALIAIGLTLTATFLTATLPLLLAPPPAHAATTPTLVERRVVALINLQRAEHGLARLSFRTSLVRAARAHTREMAARTVLTHVSENGWTPAPRVRYFGYTVADCTFWTMGEDIACGRAGTTAGRPAAIVALWMQSAPHREVLLTPRLRDIGVGIALGADGMRYFTVDLGRRIL